MTYLDGSESRREVFDAAYGHVVDSSDDNDDERYQFEAGEEGVESGGPLHAPTVQYCETHLKRVNSKVFCGSMKGTIMIRFCLLVCTNNGSSTNFLTTITL